jgi:hypothetical protein
VPPADACGLDGEFGARMLRMRCEPPLCRRVNPPELLLVDHLERVPVTDAALLLHLDDEDSATASQYEVELVRADTRVRIEQPVSTQPIVPESALLSPIHAAP